MHNTTHSGFASARLTRSLLVGWSSASRPEALPCSGSWGCIAALDLTVEAAGVFILQLRGVRISVATNDIALWGFLVPNQSCCGRAVSSTSAWSVSDTLPFEHSAAGQTAPDGVAGDGACTDLGGADRQECWPGMWRSRLQHLLSTGLCLGSVLLSPATLSHSWGPDWTVMDEIKAREGQRLQRRGQQAAPHMHREDVCFPFTPSKDVKRNASAVFFQCPELRCRYQLWAEHTTAHTDANYLLHFNRIMSLRPRSDSCWPRLASWQI